MTKRNQQKNPQLKAVIKTEPGANGRKFIPFPSNARHYIHHEKISASKLFLYALLIDYFNVEEGAAWPSQERLAVDYGSTSKTVGRHLNDLKDAGLIAIPMKGRYIPLEPLGEDEFYRANPEAWESYKEAFQLSEKRREDDHQRWAEYRDKMRGTRN